MTDRILISEKVIRAKIRSIAKQINQDFQAQEVIILSILKGSFIFMADLVREIDLEVRCEFLRMNSYVNNQSSGKVKLEKIDLFFIKNKNILIAEDIVDTGLTLKFLINLLNENSPKSLKVCSLLVKEKAMQQNEPIDYYGFVIPDQYVYGYGLDDFEFKRNLKDIYIKE